MERNTKNQIKFDERSRRIVDLGDGKMIKVSINTLGHRECENEFLVYVSAMEKYKKHLLPVIEFKDDYLVVPSVAPIHLQNGDLIESEELETIIQSMRDTASYLEERFDILPSELLKSNNIGYYNGELVFIHYGYKKGDFEKYSS